MSGAGPSRPRRRPADLSELPFPRHDAVRWFSPGMLLQTAKFVALSAVFGSYADKREVQASAATVPFHDHSEGAEAWVDYVSDVGDGFDATYSVAYLLAQPKLDVTRADGGDSTSTTRGSVLVMGGDEVYPAASARGYEERTKGPYNAALPHSDDPPVLFAVPGNHDWYDGLTSFLRFFCQGDGWVAGAPSSAAATSRCGCRRTGGCWASTSSSTPTSTRRRSSTSAGSPSGSASTTASCCARPSPAGSRAATKGPRRSPRWTTSSASCSARGPSRSG